MLKVVFMGTPDFARDSLKKIYDKGHVIEAVFTVPDRPKGRGLKILPSPVKEFCIENKIEVYQPERIKENEEIIQIIKKIKPDIICVVAYGMILPKKVLEIPEYGCINVHPSILPKYRGPAPIQWSIINGDKKTGVTTMYLNEEMDAGDIILQKEVIIQEEETSGELWNRLSTIGADLLVETLEKIEKNIAPKKKQDNNYSLAPMLDKEISKIDWENKTAIEIKNLTRGLNPLMGSYSFINNKKIKFWKLEVVYIKEFIKKHPEFEEYEYRFKDMQPGTIIYIDKKDGLYIKAKDEIIKVLEIQQENSKKMNITDYLKGAKLQVAEKFN